MSSRFVRFLEFPELERPRLVVGFTGWMDGGDASSGSLEYLIEKLAARQVATIIPDPFYIYNFPGSMEISALFRPHTEIKNGEIVSYDEPANRFFASAKHRLLLFEGKEPNIRWREYAEALLETAAAFGVSEVYFAGSVAGTVPHTRDPRFHGSVSDPRHMSFLDRHDITPSNYEGPASFITHLVTECRARGLFMASLVAEIPAYVQGRNVKSIEAVVRKLSSILEIDVNVDELRVLSLEFERKLNAVVHEKPELAELIRQTELDYDKEVLDTHEDALKEWFERQDIQPD